MNEVKNISNDVVQELISKAKKARNFSYSPYSNFKVGAALLVDDETNKIYTGCNIENAAYSPGNCAERTAVFKAVSEGYSRFKAIAIVAGKNEETDEYVSPCGMCRQVLREFVSPKDFQIIMAKSEEDYIVYTLEDLLPMSFGPDNLK